jgi:F-type H+-transporting ATPase subunit b
MSADPMLIKETVEAAQAAGPIGAFGLNAKIFVAQLVNFGIVLIVLWRFAYKPIVKMLETRQERIESSLKKADEIDERLKKAESEREEILKQARLAAQEIAQKSEMQIEDRRKEMVEKARGEVEKVVAQGKEQIASEKKEMLTEIKKEVVDVVILAAQKVLEESVDREASKKIAEEALKKAGF